MRWIVTIGGTQDDVDRLVTELPTDLSRVSEEPTQFTFTLIDPEGMAVDDAARDVARREIDLFVERLNGVGKLRWGRVFNGVGVESIRTVDDQGTEGIVVAVPGIRQYLSYEDFVRLCQAQNLPVPKPPRGLQETAALDVAAVAQLAERDPTVARVLRLLDLALSPASHDIDWGLAYSAWEVVREDLKSQGLDGASLGWWTKKELSDFTGTANSPEALGERARHGKKSGLSVARMTETDAMWFVRSVVANWVTHRLAQDSASSGAASPPL